MWQNKFDINKLKSRIKLDDFDETAEYSNNIPIKWESLSSRGIVDVFYSSDFGNSWNLVASTIENDGSYLWNTKDSVISESPFAKIKLALKDSGYHVGSSVSNFFHINLEGNGLPKFSILNENDLYDNILKENKVNLSILIGDSEKENLTLNTYYKTSIDDSYVFINETNYPFSHQTQTYALLLSNIPNSDDFYLKFEVSDSENTIIYETEKINKNTPRNSDANEHLDIVSGFSEGQVDLFIVDSKELLPYDYLITFDDTSSFGNVYYTIEKKRIKPRYFIMNY